MISMLTPLNDPFLDIVAPEVAHGLILMNPHE